MRWFIWLKSWMMSAKLCFIPVFFNQYIINAAVVISVIFKLDSTKNDHINMVIGHFDLFCQRRGNFLNFWLGYHLWIYFKVFLSFLSRKQEPKNRLHLQFKPHWIMQSSVSMSPTMQVSYHSNENVDFSRKLENFSKKLGKKFGKELKRSPSIHLLDSLLVKQKKLR